MTDQTDSVAEPESDSETFPREVVERLRAENADRRTAAREAEGRAESLAGRLLRSEVERAASAILAAPDELLAHTDPTELLGEDGYPDVDRIVAAAEFLAEERPHLAARRFAEVDQGARATSSGFDLASALRTAAGG